MRVLIVHPRDPAAPTLGGIQTFLRDFISHAPDDLSISFVGVTNDSAARPVGRWTKLDLYGRHVPFLAVAEAGVAPRSPLAIARSVRGVALLAQALLARDRIVQVHRPYRRRLLDLHRGPTVQFIHLDIRDWPGPSGWGRLRGLYREFSDADLERMTRVYIVNEFGAELLRADHPAFADRVEFLPVWYDAEHFKPATEGERSALRADLAVRLGLDPETAHEQRFVLGAMRLTEIKQPLLAIEALAALAGATSQAVQLVIAGSGELMDDMRVLAARLGVAGRVHLLGDQPRDEVARLMRAADSFLLTARAEGGGPRVVLEALACGLPVVSTVVGEVRRTVHSGRNGWLVENPTPAALAEGLAWVLAQPRRELAQAAVEAVAPYTAERMLAGLYATYRNLRDD